MVLGSKKKKEKKGEEERKLTDLLNELIGIEIDNRKLQDANQKKIGEMYDNITKLVEEHREANEQILDGIGRLEGAVKDMGTAEVQVPEAPVEEEVAEAEEEEEAPAEEEKGEEVEEEEPEAEEEEAPAEEETKEEEAEAPAEEEKEGSEDDDVLRRLRQLREKGG